ncbi:sigma-54-dependent Fis family transcriptional regulator [candidate division KSB1 bacterium]|nr:sigma-54-dependent Fis family transcriptional regulator [candidate division KSB1 bacterium]
MVPIPPYIADIFKQLPFGIIIARCSDYFFEYLNHKAKEILGFGFDLKNNADKHSPRVGRITQLVQETCLKKHPIQNFLLDLDISGSESTVWAASTAFVKSNKDDSYVLIVLHERAADFRKQNVSVAAPKFESLVGESDVMKKLNSDILNVAQYQTTVLLYGETGTGKELVARAIHALSPRSQGPFVPVNCSALTSSLLESELFGHVKGGFTGAYKDRKGRFEVAQGGTIFLDEVGTLSPSVQVKLLRALQERIIERVGGEDFLPIDVRVLSATNRNLSELVQRREFREDLFYRLKVIQIDLPPLRERKSDIIMLAEYFLEKLARYYNRPVLRISKAAKKLLLNYFWPGNVRELENAVEHAMILTTGSTIEPQFLPPEIRFMKSDGMPPPPSFYDLRSEEEKISRALAAFGYNMTKAAESLNMHRTTLWRKMKEYGMTKKK